MEPSGHKSHQMLKRYSHPTVDRKRQALEAAAGHNPVTNAEIGSPATTKPPSELAIFLRILLVDGRRLELPTSALRTRRSPS